MTDKEFKRLSRSQLIDIIYQFQLKQNELTAENERLTKALADKRLRMSKVGNIAEASLEMYNVMQSAQEAAEQYLNEIRIMRDETEEKCQQLLKIAQKRADAIVANAKAAQPAYDSDIEEIVKEFGQKHKITGEQQ